MRKLMLIALSLACALPAWAQPTWRTDHFREIYLKDNPDDVASSVTINKTWYNSVFTSNDGALSDDDLSDNDTGDLAEGTNLYYTDERVDDRAAALIQDGTDIAWTYDDTAGTLTADFTGDVTEDDLTDDSIGTLSDVTLTSPSQGDVLYRSGGVWGDAALASVETDPVFGASDVAGVTSTDISNWDAAYSGIHDAVSLDTNADTILGLSTQQITLDDQTANYVFAGPTSGGAATPAFRALVAGDIPDLSGTYLTAESDPVFAAMNTEAELETQIGTNMLSESEAAAAYQPHDSDLTDLSGLTAATGDLIIGGGAGDWQKLAAGTENYVLTMGASTPAWTALPSGVAGANPSATVNGTATNGSASTFLRSDGAPALANPFTPSGGLQSITGGIVTSTSGSFGTVVGVGIAAASVTRGPLHLHGSAGATVYTHYTDATTGATDTDGFNVGIGSSQQAVLVNRENTSMDFYTNATSRMSIAAGGTVSFSGLVRTDNGALGTPTIATSAGEGYFEGDLESDGNLDVAGTGTFDGKVTLTGDGAVNGAIVFDGTAGGGGESISYKDSGGTNRTAFLMPGSNVVALANRASNGVVQIRANTSTAGSGGEVTAAIFEDDVAKFSGLLRVDNGALGTPTIATSAGEFYAEGDIEADGNLNVAGTGTFGSPVTIAGGSLDALDILSSNSGTGSFAVRIPNGAWYAAKNAGGSNIRLFSVSATNDVYMGAVDNAGGKVFVREDGITYLTFDGGAAQFAGLLRTDNGTLGTPTIATGAGEFYAEGDIEAGGDFKVIGAGTVSGVFSYLGKEYPSVGDQAITAATNTLSSSYRVLVVTTSAGATTTMTSTPTIAAGTARGQLLTIINADTDGDSVVLQHNTSTYALSLDGGTNKTINAGKSINLIWTGGSFNYWLQLTPLTS